MRTRSAFRTKQQPDSQDGSNGSQHWLNIPTLVCIPAVCGPAALSENEDTGLSAHRFCATRKTNEMAHKKRKKPRYVAAQRIYKQQRIHILTTCATVIPQRIVSEATYLSSYIAQPNNGMLRRNVRYAIKWARFQQTNKIANHNDRSNDISHLSSPQLQ